MNQDAQQGRTGRRLMSRLNGAILIAVLLMVIIPCGVIHHGDGQARYAQAKAIALRGSFDIPWEFLQGNPESGLIRRAPNGRYYPVHGPGMPLLWTPLVWLASWSSRLAGLPLDAVAGFLISLVNPFLVLETWCLLRRQAAAVASNRTAHTLGLLYLFGTMALVYANTSFSEVVCGLALLYVLATASFASRSARLIPAGFVAGILCLVRYEMFLLFAAVPMILLYRRLWTPVRWTALASVVGPGLAATLNWVQRGSPMRAGPGTLSDQFAAPWTGLAGYVADMDKALWLYFPVLWLAIPAIWHARRDPRFRPLLAATAIMWLTYVPLYAASVFDGVPNWGGGLCYGTRHFVILMPVTVLMLAPLVAWLTRRTGLLARTALIAPMAFGLVIQLPGTSVKSEQADMVSRVTGESNLQTHFKLLWLKLTRGPGHPEVYRRSELVAARSDEVDPVMDFRDRRTFRWLHHWWAMVLASKMQGYSLLGAHGYREHSDCAERGRWIIDQRKFAQRRSRWVMAARRQE